MSDLSGQSLGRYHILEQLGEGGMATVYKAYDTRLERPVAVKVILPMREHSEKFLKRFEREAKSLAGLSHPNIVKVLDYGEHEGLPYIVMEYVPGGMLKEKLGKPMGWKEAAKLLAPVARALAYAHSQKMVHRDVKPANILLTQSGEPMLSDFGVAKMLKEEKPLELTGTGTGAGVGVGTPEYMAPEQGMGKEVDGRTDVYSLGIVFYELVTGRKPFRADTALAVLYKQMTEPLPHPKQYVSELPDGVVGVMLKALAKDPKDRYQDAGDFADALERLARGEVEGVWGEPVRETRPSRRIYWLAGGLGLAVVVVGIVLGSLWMKQRADQSQIAMVTEKPIPTNTNNALVVKSTLVQPTPIPTELNMAATSISASAGGGTILPTPTGKLLFSADFGDGFTHGFEFNAGGSWKVVDDGTGNKVLQLNSPSTGSAIAVFGPDNLTDGIVEFRMRTVSADSQAQQGVFEFGFRFQDPDHWNQYLVLFNPIGFKLDMNFQDTNSVWNIMEGISGSGSIQTQDGSWFKVRVEFQGEKMGVFVNGTRFITAEDSRLEKGGSLSFGAYGPVVVQLDDIKVWNFGST